MRACKSMYSCLCKIIHAHLHARARAYAHVNTHTPHRAIVCKTCSIHIIFLTQTSRHHNFTAALLRFYVIRTAAQIKPSLHGLRRLFRTTLTSQLTLQGQVLVRHTFTNHFYLTSFNMMQLMLLETEHCRADSLSTYHVSLFIALYL